MDKIKYLKIKAIRPIGKVRTYDISVDDNHNFLLGNRILSHNSADLVVFGRLTGEADKEAGTKQLYRDNLITRRQVQDLSVLMPGEYYFSESGKKAKKRYLFLPRSMYWKKGYGNFYDHIWKNLVDKWIDVRGTIEELDEEFKKAKEIILEEERKKRELARLEKERKEQEEQEKKMAELEKKEKMKHAVKAKAKLIFKSNKVESEPEKTDLELAMDDVNEELAKSHDNEVTTENDEIEDIPKKTEKKQEERIKSSKKNIINNKLKIDQETMEVFDF